MEAVGAVSAGRVTPMATCGRWVLAMLAPLAAAGVLAQTAPQTPAQVPSATELAPRTPPRTDAQRLPPQPGAEQTPRELEKPADALTLNVRGYALSPNAPPELLAVLHTLLAPYVGERRSYDDLVDAAADVTRWLQRELGWYLGYAYLPEQDPKDGIVRIALLEGRLDGIELRWPDSLPVRGDIVRAYLDRLKPGEILRVADVERVVFLINDLRGITARFELKAGRQPGTASIVVTGQAESRWSGKVDADANGSRFLGAYRAGVVLTGNSLLGRGDALALNALASVDGGLGFALAGYTLPVGNDGLKLGSSLSLVRYRLDEAQFPLGVNGDALGLSLSALYPWIRSRNLNLFAVATLDVKHHVDRQDAAGAVTRRTLSGLGLAFSGDLRDNWLGGGVNTFELGVSHAQVHYPEGRPGGLDDAPRHTKITLAANRLQNLVDGRLLLYAALRGQWALDNLDSSEQFRAGGPDGVRAFAPGEGTGDSGLVASLELRLLPPEAWLGRRAREFVVSLFVDHAALQRRADRPALSTFVNRAQLGGAGLALSWERPREWAARLSLAAPTRGQASSDTARRNPRVYAQLSWFY